MAKDNGMTPEMAANGMTPEMAALFDELKEGADG